MKKFLSVINFILILAVLVFSIFNLLLILEVIDIQNDLLDIVSIVGNVLIIVSVVISLILKPNKTKDKNDEIKSNVEPNNVIEQVQSPTISELVEEVKNDIVKENVIEEVETPILENDDVVLQETDVIEEVEIENEKTQELVVKELDMGNIKFEGKLMYAPYEVKEQYSIIKNHFLRYSGVTSRISNNKETFRKSGILAQIKLVSNKLNVYLNVIPEPFIREGYKVKNVGDTKQYEETPLHIKITNEKSIKEFVDILDVMMTSKGINKKQRFKEVNYVDYLYPNGETILNGLGLSSEYLVNSINSKIIPSDLPDDLLEYSAVIDGEPLTDNMYKTTIYLDNLTNYYQDGDIINKQNLLSKKLIKKDDFVVIKGRGTLDKRFIIIADDFDVLATKMIYITNGTIVRIKH